MKRTLRVALVVCFAAAAVAAMSSAALAQRVDIAFGVSTTDAPGASQGFNNDHNPTSLTGGAYPGFSGDVEAFHHIGIGGEIYWRASQAGNYDNYAGLNYRPVIWNANVVYTPKLVKDVYLEAVAGIGGLSTRYYTGTTTCGPFSCSNYQSSNHFDGDFGGGIKIYPVGGFFIRPEARIYVVNNNTDFSSNHFARYGVSIGYTFGRH